MATTADFKNGLCIKHNGNIWKIESFQHVKPGKGPAFVRTKIRNLNTGRILEATKKFYNKKLKKNSFFGKGNVSKKIYNKLKLNLNRN